MGLPHHRRLFRGAEHRRLRRGAADRPASVDLAPALVLGFQLIMGILFGIIGLFLADPLLAMIKLASVAQRAARR